MIARFRRGVKDVFAFQRYYAGFLGSYRRFGTTYIPHLQESKRITLEDSADTVPKSR